jgi:hypothetical protein
VEEAQDSQTLLEHLFASLQTMNKKQKTLKVEIDHGLWPHSGVAKFKYNLDNSGWSLKCRQDFLKQWTCLAMVINLDKPILDHLGCLFDIHGK